MQKSRSVLVLLVIVALALAGGFFVGRNATPNGSAEAPKPGAHAEATPTAPQQAAAAPRVAPKIVVKRVTKSGGTGNGSAPLPPAGAPLAQIYNELEKRAAAGDGDAASRLYQDVRRCAARRNYQNSLTMLLPSLHAKGMNANQLKNQEHLAQDLQRKLDFVKETQSECEGVSNDQLDSVVPTALQAAQLGDQQALTCYLDSSYVAMPDLISHPDWLGDFKQNALQLADAAIQQGNWKAVEVLQRAYLGIFATPLSQTTGADPVTRYRYLLLERLGAHGDFASRLTRNIDDAAADLTPSQLSDADAWAHDTFAQYFQDSGPSNIASVGANICPAVAE